MFCPKCGQQLQPGAIFCTGCGAPVGASAQPQAPAQPQYNPQPQVPAQPQYNAQPQAPAQPQYNPQPQAPAQPQYNAQPQAPVQPQYNPQPQAPVQPQAPAMPQYNAPPQPQYNVQPQASAPRKNNVLIGVIIAIVLVAVAVVAGILLGGGDSGGDDGDDKAGGGSKSYSSAEKVAEAAFTSARNGDIETFIDTNPECLLKAQAEEDFGMEKYDKDEMIEIMEGMIGNNNTSKVKVTSAEEDPDREEEAEEQIEMIFENYDCDDEFSEIEDFALVEIEYERDGSSGSAEALCAKIDGNWYCVSVG